MKRKQRLESWMSMAAVAALAVIIGAGTAEAQTLTPEYVITGAAGTGFSAQKGVVPVGGAGQLIQTVINAVKDDAGSSPCTIQFGTGTDTLNIGTGFIEFGIDWGGADYPHRSVNLE